MRKRDNMNAAATVAYTPSTKYIVANDTMTPVNAVYHRK
jgi:hypothetical protein